MKKNTKDIKDSVLKGRIKQANKRAKEVEASQGKSDDSQVEPEPAPSRTPLLRCFLDAARSMSDVWQASILPENGGAYEGRRLARALVNCNGGIRDLTGSISDMRGNTSALKPAAKALGIRSFGRQTAKSWLSSTKPTISRF